MGGPEFEPCPACREIPEAEHSTALADEFVAAYERLGGSYDDLNWALVKSVFTDLLGRKVIE